MNMKSDQTFIQLNNLVKTFNGTTEEFKALDKVNLSLNKGEFVLICGKSGSGKSTLLNMISGIDYPTSGEIWIDDIQVHRLTTNQLAKWRGKNVGIVFQFFQLMPTLNVLENILLPMEFVNVIRNNQQSDRGMELLEKVGISKLARKFPHTLSGGEKQRVAIARALANDPGLLIADEPTGNLDTENTAIVHSVFDKLAEDGKTIVYVTHEQNVKLNYSRKVHMLDGRIIEIEKNNHQKDFKLNQTLVAN